MDNNIIHGVEKCRLCGGINLQFQFDRTVLNKYKVGYFRCDNCKSLQTEHPYWLDEAYAKYKGSGGLDVGALQRTINNFVRIYCICRFLGINDVLDMGGGDGLLCRFLRDYGVNAFSNDKFVTPRYSDGFTEPNFNAPDVLSCFEVFEHFSSPLTELENLFMLCPKVLIASSQLYSRQSVDWDYLGDTHVFFYSKDALSSLAARFGYELVIVRDNIIFYKDVGGLGFRVLLDLLFGRFVFRALKAITLNKNPIGVSRDYDQLKRGR